MTSRTNERGGVKVHAVLLAVLFYQCTSSVVGNPVSQWINSLPAGSQYHPIVEHFINCYKTVSTQTNNDIGFMKCLTLINSMLKTDLPDKTPSLNSMFQPPPDFNGPKPVSPPTRKTNKSPEPSRNLQDNSYVTATVPNSKILLYELKKLWDSVKDNPRVSTNRQVVEKLNKMRATLQQNPTQQNILNLITDLRNHLNDEDTTIVRNNVVSSAPTTAPIPDTSPLAARKIIKPKATTVSVPSTEVSNEDDELSFRAHFISPESTSATVAAETSPTKVEKTDSPTFRSSPQLKPIKVIEVTEKATELVTSATESNSANLYKKPGKLVANPKIENIDRSTTENPEKFTKTVRNNFLLNNLAEKQTDNSDVDEEISPRSGINDLIAAHAHTLPHAVEDIVNTDIYSPHLAPQLQNFVPVSHPSYTQFYPPYPSYSPPHFSPHSYMVPVRPEDDAHLALAGVPTPNHFYKCN